jgi:uncharacterized protein (DUF1778 family)
MDIRLVKGHLARIFSSGYPLAMAEETRKHSQSVLLRFEPEQLEMIDRAADHAGLNRTSWLRAAVIRAAREELGEKKRSGGKG